MRVYPESVCVVEGIERGNLLATSSDSHTPAQMEHPHRRDDRGQPQGRSCTAPVWSNRHSDQYYTVFGDGHLSYQQSERDGLARAGVACGAIRPLPEGDGG